MSWKPEPDAPGHYWIKDYKWPAPGWEKLLADPIVVEVRDHYGKLWMWQNTSMFSVVEKLEAQWFKIEPPDGYSKRPLSSEEMEPLRTKAAWEKPGYIQEKIQEWTRSSKKSSPGSS